MRIAIDVTVDPWELAKTLDHEEARDFILAIDETVAEFDFTLDLMKGLALAMEKEGENSAPIFRQIGALLHSIK